MWSTSNCNHQQHPQHLTFKALLSACLLLGLSSSSTVNNADDNIYAPRPANKEIIFTKVNTANLLRPLQDSSEVTVTGVRALQEEAATEANTILPFSNVSEEVCEEFCPEDTGESSGWISALPAVLQYVLIVFLISFSAFFSGLTLGIMGLDCTGLEIIMEGDSEKDAAAAKAIYPLRKRGNLLLCTFLLGNVAVNALLSILLADKVGGLVGFLGSTALIVIFGEIVPQAVCSRYALLIGSRMVPIVRVIVALVYPIAAPIAYMLDKALGKELATTYSSTELMELLQIHVRELVLDKDTANTMAGALKYRDVTVGQVMTPLENTFMLNAEEKFNFELVATIFKTGYSRIPVYEVTQDNIIGLLFVKDLVFIDPGMYVVISGYLISCVCYYHP